jgi:homocysteine S-methyltransferase
VGINCCAPWDASAFLEEVDSSGKVSRGKPFLSAMPNAGGFQRIGNRFMSQVTPEYMGQLARTFVEKGVQLVGGCCEVHPPHIREMHNYLHGYAASRRTAGVVAEAVLEPTGVEQKRGNGRFSQKLFAGEFAVSVEILPSRGTAPAVIDRKVGFVSSLVASDRADALDITDGSRGISLMHPGDFVAVLRERLSWTGTSGDGIELIPHFTGRDLNVMGIQSRLIGYHARRIHNVLFVTGDPPKMSPTYPRSTAVFDLDSETMVRYTHNNLNAGVDFGGRPLGRDCDPRTHFTIGTGFEPEALDTVREVEKLRRKVEAGADYIMTQPVFHPAPLEKLKEFRGQVPILVGVMILANLDQAQRVGEVPGVVIPESIYQKLGRFEETSDQAKLAIEIAIEQVQFVRRDGWEGLYLMSPANSTPVLQVLKDGLE